MLALSNVLTVYEGYFAWYVTESPALYCLILARCFCLFDCDYVEMNLIFSLSHTLGKTNTCSSTSKCGWINCNRNLAMRRTAPSREQYLSKMWMYFQVWGSLTCSYKHSNQPHNIHKRQENLTSCRGNSSKLQDRFCGLCSQLWQSAWCSSSSMHIRPLLWSVAVATGWQQWFTEWFVKISCDTRSSGSTN